MATGVRWEKYVKKPGKPVIFMDTENFTSIFLEYIGYQCNKYDRKEN